MSQTRGIILFRVRLIKSIWDYFVYVLGRELDKFNTLNLSNIHFEVSLGASAASARAASASAAVQVLQYKCCSASAASVSVAVQVL